MLPIHRRFRTTLTAAFAALTAGTALAACDNPLGPDGIAPQGVPFYYYENEKIYLRVEPTRLTAVPETAGDTVTLRTALSQAGVAVDSIRPLWMENHWFIHLAPGTSARRAESAARQLRLNAGVRFASAVYRVRNSDCPLYMVNRLVVRFRAGADADQIARLNASTGVRNEQVQPWGTLYEYPADMAATPLELAAHYYRQRIVDWAEADRIDGCLRIGAQPAP